MAVVTKYGSGAKDPAVLRNTDTIYNAARMKCMNSLVTVTNGDNIASTYEFGEIPSNAIIDPSSVLDNAAITAAAINLGFYTPKGNGAMGTVLAAAALASALSVAAAATQTLRTIGTLTLANSNKRAWELAGLAADPGGTLSVVAALTAAATATGVMGLTLRYSTN